MKIHPLKKILSENSIPELKWSKSLETYLLTFRLYPGFLDNGYIEILPSVITKKIDILINKILREIDLVLDIHHERTSKYHKVVFRHLIKLLIQKIIEDEYKMILNIKEFTHGKSIIEGKYLSFSTKNDNFTIFEKNISDLINNYGRMLNLFLLLYREHHEKWLAAFMSLGRELPNQKARLETNNHFEKLNMAEVNESVKNNSKKQKSNRDKELLIKNIKICRDILINAKHKNPYVLTQISKIYKEKFEPIAYTTLRGWLSDFGIPTKIKEFTKIYG
jgi:hypothetical protein